MVVALKSLRIDASFDASSYARGAADLVSANERMVASDRARGAALAAADAQLQKAIPGVTALSRTFITGYGSGAQFESALRRIGNAVDRGMGLDRAQVLLEGVYRKFGLTADAAALAGRGQSALLPIVTELNSRYAAQTAVLERNSVAARRMAETQQYQAQLNARVGVNDNFGGAGRAQDINAYGKSLDDLRAKYNPLFAAGRGYRDQLAEINQAYRVGAFGAIGSARAEQERAEAIMSTKSAFVAQVNAMRPGRDALAANDNAANNAANSYKKLSFESRNLGFQIIDVTQQALAGQSAFMILAQQGGQLAQIFAFSSVSIGSMLRQLGGVFTSLLRPAVLAFGGVAAIIGTAVAALFSYAGAQREVQRSLTGIGRASGVTVGDINAIASQGASPLGQSISEAREFGSALAATGKVGRDEIGSLVKLGHDFATTLDVGGKEAAQALAKAMADPVRGAEQLNERLGFMDAAQQRQIKNLVEQNRLAEAQRVIIAGIQSSIASASELTGFWSKTWTAISNAISNSYDWLGRVLSRASGIGETLDDQIARARRELDAARRGAATPSALQLSDTGTVINVQIDSQSVAIAEANYDRLIKKQREQAEASEAARLRLESFKIASAAMNLLPEIEQTDRLKNAQDLLVRTLIDVQVSGGPTSEILTRLGVSYEQLAAAVAKASSNVRNFKTEHEQALAQQATALKATTAFSPGAKGDIAFEQRLNAELARGTEVTKARTLAEGDRRIAIKGVQVALSEAGRERELSGRQGVASAQLEIELIGKTIGEQVRLKADLQARQQLEQEAARNRTAFDGAAFARLQKINAELGVQAQLRAKAEIAAQNKFNSETLLLSPENVQIAQQLKGLYPDVATALNSSEAAAMRLNNNLKLIVDTAREIGGEILKSVVHALMEGKNVGEALSATLKSLSMRLADKAIESLLSGDFTKAAIAGISAIATFIGSKLLDNSQDKALEEAKKKFADMRDEVNNFNAAASGFDLSPFVTAIQQIKNTALELIKAAMAAGEAGKAVQLIFSALRQINSQVDQYIQPKGDSVAEQIAQESANAQQLINELNDLSTQYGIPLNRTVEILAAAADHIAEIQRKAQEEIEKRRLAADDRLFAAITDLDTLDGQLAAFDREAQREREEEIRAGGEALVNLEAAQAAERFNVIRDFNDQIAEDARRTAQEQADAQTRAAKTVLEYLTEHTAGSGSTLSPSDRLVAATTAYNAKLALAQTGDNDALSSITTDAENLRVALRDVFASSSSYQTGWGAIQAQLLALPGIQEADDPLVVAMRDAITAIQATTTAVGGTTTAVGGTTSAVGATTLAVGGTTIAIGGTTTAVGGTTSAVTSGTTTTVGRLDTAITRFDTTITKLGETVSRLDSALSKLDSSNALLTAIQGLQSTASSQLTILKDNLVATGQTNTGDYATLVLPPPSNNDAAITALRKIVYNTGVIAFNTNVAATRQSPGQFGAFGVFAEGGWITGGVPGRDSVPILAMEDEYMLQRSATRSLTSRYGASALDTLNSGRLPFANDNRHRASLSFGDNGAHFERLGQRLERAIVGAAMAKINALHGDNERLRGDVHVLTRATTANKPLPRRPGTRARAA